MRTFNYLQDKGIIFNKRGIGYFVSEDGLQKTKVLRKEDFVHNELPKIFKTMALLQLTMEDLGTYFQQYQQEKPIDNSSI